MNVTEFNTFTQALADKLDRRSDVLGLILLGSTAGTHHRPDSYSDHDFFVIVTEEHAEAFRARLNWLPERTAPVVHHYRDTLHGARVIYADGHLLEYAVFTPDEIALSRNHHARIAFDKLGDLQDRLKPTLSTPPAKVERLLSDLYLHLLVGLGRHSRGEVLAGRQQLQFAAQDVLALLHTLKPPAHLELVDDRNPWRRVEQTHPAQAQVILRALHQETPQAAHSLVTLAREVAGQHPAWDEQVIQAILTA